MEAFGRRWEQGVSMRHIRPTIEELRRYIAKSEARADLEEVDALLAVALEEVRRKLAAEAQRAHQPSAPPTRKD